MPTPKILNINAAKTAWDAFNQKYSSLLVDFKIPKSKPLVKQQLVKQENKAEPKNTPDQAARFLQDRWRFLRQSDKAKVPVRVGAKDEAELIYFLNQSMNKNLKKSLNKTKLSLLEGALQKGDWGELIFQDVNLPYLALTLYQAKKITQQQFYSTLEFAQNKKDFKFKSCYQVLDENDQFTENAKKILLPKMIFFSLESPEDVAAQMESFRLLLLQLPRSEQVFYTTDLGRYDSDRTNKNNYLAFDLARLDTFMDMRNNQILHIPFGMKDAIGIGTFGVDEYIRILPRLGVQSLDDIEYGVRRGWRPAAMAFPQTVAYKNIHGYKNVNDFEALGHDVAHSKMMSNIPASMLKGMQHFADVTRKAFGIPWSKEIWSWIDSEYNYFFPYRKGVATMNFTVKEHTELFCDLLKAGGLPPNKNAGGYLIHNAMETATVTLVGLNIFLDMIEHKDEWLKLKIDPRYFKNPFAMVYAEITHVYHQLDFMKTNDRKLNLFILQSYFLLKAASVGITAFNRLLELIIKNPESVSSDISFAKLTKKDVAEDAVDNVNTLVLNYKNTQLSVSVIMDLIQNLTPTPRL